MAKQITLVKSLIGRKQDQIDTAHSLGLKKIGPPYSLTMFRQREKSIRFPTSSKYRTLNARRCEQ